MSTTGVPADRFLTSAQVRAKFLDYFQGKGHAVQKSGPFTLTPGQQAVYTITVTNLGEQGVDLVHGVIYPPQVALVGFGGQGRLYLRDQGGVVKAGRLAQRGGHGAVDAAHPDLRVRQVDQGVAGGIQAGHGGADGRGLPAADFARDDA